MKKVVSQLKRTLSTVLAMMMVVTAIPQMAMPVLADDIIVEEVAIDEIAADVDEVVMAEEDAIVTVSGDEVDPDDADDGDDGENLEISYPQARIFVKTKNGKAAGNVGSFKPTAKRIWTWDGEEYSETTAANYRFDGTAPEGFKINGKTGLIQIKKGTPIDKSVSVNVIAEYINNADITAKATVTFDPKAEEIGDIVVYSVSADGLAYPISEVSKKGKVSAKVEAGDPVLVKVLKKGVSVNSFDPYDAADVAKFAKVSLTTSKKNISYVGGDFVTVYAKGTTTVTANVDGQKKSVKITATNKTISANDIVSIAFSDIEKYWFDEEDGSLHDATITVSGNKAEKVKVDISGNSLTSPYVVPTVFINGEQVAWKNYGMTVTVKGGKKTAAGYLFNTKFSKVTRKNPTSTITVKPMTVTVKVGKKVYANIEVSNTPAVTTKAAIAVSTNKVGKKKVAQTVVAKKVSENQVIQLTGVSANEYVTFDPDYVSWTNKKKGSAYGKAKLALWRATTDKGVEFDSDYVLKAGTYKFYATVRDAETGLAKSAPTPITFKVVKAKKGDIKKASWGLIGKKSEKGVVKISANNVSGNGVAVKMGATSKKTISANYVYLNGLTNAVNTKTKEVNNFTKYFAAEFDYETKTISIVVKPGVDLTKIDDKDLVGFISYEYNSLLVDGKNEDGYKTAYAQIKVDLGRTPAKKSKK